MNDKDRKVQVRERHFIDRWELRAALERHKFDLAAAFVEIHKNAMDCFYEANDEEKMLKLHALKVASDVVRDIAMYTMPRLKTLEIKAPPSTFSKMTNKQKIQAMKEAISKLEEAEEEEEESGQSG